MENLIDALDRLIKARTTESAARERFAEGGGYDWSYAGYDELRAVEAATVNFTRELNTVIDARIKELFSSLYSKELHSRTL